MEPNRLLTRLALTCLLALPATLVFGQAPASIVGKKITIHNSGDDNSGNRIFTAIALDSESIWYYESHGSEYGLWESQKGYSWKATDNIGELKMSFGTAILDFSSSNKGSFKVSDSADGVTYTGTFEISEDPTDSSLPFDKYFSDDFTDLDKSNSIWPLQHSQGEHGITAKQANGTFTLTGTFTERWFSGDEGEDFGQISERWFYNGQQATLLPLTKDWIVAGESFARSSSPSAARIAIQLLSEEIFYTEIAIGPSNEPPATAGSAHWLTELRGSYPGEQVSGVGIPEGGTDGTYRIRHVASEKTFHCEYLDGASWKPIMTFNWHTGAYVHLGELLEGLEQSSGQVERWVSLEGQYVQPVMLFTVPPGVNVADNQLGFSSFSVTEGAGDGSTPQQVNVAAAASPATGGTVTGGGQVTRGSTVTLTATPSESYRFTGWSGDATGADNPLYITVEADKTVTASFEKVDEPLLQSALANSGTDRGNGWREADWFGFYFPTSSGWHYHAEHGWIFPVGETLDSIWFWDLDLGWCWTSQEVYPYVYRHDPEGWLYYLRESKNPRRFYDFAANAWTSVSRQEEAQGEQSDSSSNKAGDTFTVPDLSLEMLWVEPGTFTMGSPSSETGRSSRETQHQVTLTEGFWLGKYEVMQAQWEKVMGSNRSYFEGADRPVEKVSWNDVMSFCEKLTEQESEAGRLPAGMAYQLPTEAQWEYACRAGTTTAYSWGDNIASTNANYAYDGWGTGLRRTSDVGQYAANPWGFHDMHGNVWEWCADWYEQYTSGAESDPVGPADGSIRVTRGGSWDSTANYARSAIRYGYESAVSYSHLGFRLSLRPASQ